MSASPTSPRVERRKSWKQRQSVPRFLDVAIRRGLKLADSIGIEEANDKTWLTIKFKKWPTRK